MTPADHEASQTSGKPIRRKGAAWGVHLFTMTGVIWAGLATLALIDQDLQMMWLWLGVALVVDGVDGTLARKADVARWAPSFDGAALDLIVDFLTWTFLPAVFMYLHIPMGSQCLAMLMFVLVCTSSMFCYCNVGMKSEDYYFVGFPAAWNLVAVVLWVLGTGPVVNVVVTVVLAALTLSPLTFVHPFRVGTLRWANIVATFVWVVATGWLVALHRQGCCQLTGPPVPSTVDAPTALLVVWWTAAAWLIGISVWRSVTGPNRRGMRRPDGDPAST
ncbi:phosphatidylcholine synthase [Schaalia sp. 19OD2882]|nr:phosphatidylcholine synthase [Schaalia sp. 19OD2882]